jgi:hypothetical protein
VAVTATLQASPTFNHTHEPKRLQSGLNHWLERPLGSLGLAPPGLNIRRRGRVNYGPAAGLTRPTILPNLVAS